MKLINFSSFSADSEAGSEAFQDLETKIKNLSTPDQVENDTNIDLQFQASVDKDCPSIQEVNGIKPFKC